LQNFKQTTLTTSGKIIAEKKIALE